MLRHFDHVTFVVDDVSRVRAFFSLLGFREDKDVVISGAKFSQYMGVDGIEAEHVTLVLSNAEPRTEIQLLNIAGPVCRAQLLRTVRPVEPGQASIISALRLTTSRPRSLGLAGTACRC